MLAYIMGGKWQYHQVPKVDRAVFLYGFSGVFPGIHHSQVFVLWRREVGGGVLSMAQSIQGYHFICPRGCLISDTHLLCNVITIKTI